MLKTLDRYTYTECAPTFLLSLGVFTFVLLLHRLTKLSDMVIAKGVPVWEVGRLLLLALPTLMPILLPISLLLAVLLAMGRYSADSEIVAMRSCGIGLARNLHPVMVFSTAVMILAAVVSLWLQPLSAQQFRAALYQTVVNRINVSADAGTFTELASGITLFAKKLDGETGQLEGLFLHTASKPLPNATIIARTGTVSLTDNGIALDLIDAEIHQPGEAPGEYRRTRAESCLVTIPLPSPETQVLAVEERTSFDLYQQSYVASVEPDAMREARLEFHRRFALPLSCLVLGLLGGSLGMHHGRSGKSRGLALCLLVLFVYYALLTVGNTMGKRGRMPAELAMWLPNLTLGALAIYAFVRKNRERPLPLEQQFIRLAGLFRRIFKAKDAEGDEVAP